MKERNFYTLSEYNQFFKEQLTDKPFKDDWSRTIIEKLLLQYCNTPITNGAMIYRSVGECYWDLMVRSKDFRNLAIEIKYRFDKIYKTMTIDEGKYKSFIKNLKNRSITSGNIFTIWPNGEIWWNDDILNPIIEERRQNKTTNVSKLTDGQKEDKITYNWYPKKKWYCYLFYDKALKTFTPIILENPTTIEKLEYDYEQQMNNSVSLF